jgi:hypothetical protein
MQAYPSDSPVKRVPPARNVEGRAQAVATDFAERRGRPDDAIARTHNMSTSSGTGTSHQHVSAVGTANNPGIWQEIAGNRDSLPP